MTTSFTPWMPAKHPQPKGGEEAGRADTPRTPRCRTRRGHREHTALPGGSPLPHTPWKKKTILPTIPNFLPLSNQNKCYSGREHPCSATQRPPQIALTRERSFTRAARHAAAVQTRDRSFGIHLGMPKAFR